MSLRLVVEVPDWIVDRYKETGVAAPSWSQQAMGAALAAAEQASAIELTDREVGVLIDSLAFMRDGLRREGLDAPNVESALDKVKSLMTPATYGLRIEGLS